MFREELPCRRWEGKFYRVSSTNSRDDLPCNREHLPCNALPQLRRGPANLQGATPCNLAVPRLLRTLHPKKSSPPPDTLYQHPPIWPVLGRLALQTPWGPFQALWGGSQRPVAPPGRARHRRPSAPETSPRSAAGGAAAPLTYPPAPLGSKTRPNGLWCENLFPTNSRDDLPCRELPCRHLPCSSRGHTHYRVSVYRVSSANYQGDLPCSRRGQGTYCRATLPGTLTL